MKRIESLSMFLLLFAAGSRAHAEVSILNHNTDDTGSTSAVCLAAPDRETGSLMVDRIRITATRATATTYTFTHKRTSDALYDTENVSGVNCAAPGCATVLVLEGVQPGSEVEARDLALSLPRGSRLYMHTDSNIGTDYQTVEVGFRQSR